MSIILGIDPGRKGALALLDTETQRVECHDMPDTTANLHDFIAGLPIIKRAVLEKPFCGPVMGRRTIAVMFEQYGVLRGALQWRDIPFIEVQPAKWKAALALSKDKGASRDKAGQIFPDDAAQFARAKDDGRAEAALMAWWGKDK
nr:hypothetical protein [uncultured Roseovarius sp.]